MRWRMHPSGFYHFCHVCTSMLVFYRLLIFYIIFRNKNMCYAAFNLDWYHMAVVRRLSHSVHVCWAKRIERWSQVFALYCLMNWCLIFRIICSHQGNDIKTYDFLTGCCVPADWRRYVTCLFPKALDVIVESTDRDSILWTPFPVTESAGPAFLDQLHPVSCILCIHDRSSSFRSIFQGT